MFLVKETSPTKKLRTGNCSVQTSPTPLTLVDGKINHGLLLRSPGTNGADINIGLNDGSDSFVITPGGSIDLPIDDASLLYVWSATPGLVLNYMAI